jgi:Ni,Fe-hydrogenase III large subunit
LRHASDGWESAATFRSRAHPSWLCNDAAFVFLLTHFGILRERVVQAAGAAFGHRLMMDSLIPGGVARDIDVAAIARDPRPQQRVL